MFCALSVVFPFRRRAFSRGTGMAAACMAGAWMAGIVLPAAGEAQPAAAGETQPAAAGETQPAAAGETQPAAAGDNRPPAPDNVRAAPSTFMIEAFDVAGVTRLEQSVVEEAVYPFTGPDRTSDDVEKARKALQEVYAARGYEAVQVDVPPQPEESFAQGLIQIQVSEVPVASVRVTGLKHHSLAVIRRQLPAVAEGQALNLKALETELASANRFPDRTINPTFVPGTVPGTIDVDLQVEDTLPLHGSLELSNDHSPSTEPLRLNASLRYADLWRLGHTLSLSYIVAPQDRKQSEVISGSYTIPFLGSPWTFVLYGYKSNSNVNSLGGVSILGDGYQVGTRLIYRLPNKKIVQSVTLGLDYKNFNQDISLSDELASTAPIEYMPLYVAYSASYGDERTNVDVTASVTAGLRTFKKLGCFKVDGKPCTPEELEDQFKNKDFDSNENFVHGNVELNVQRTLPFDFVAAFKAYGQLADSHLVTNEQFAIGGLSTVRGYLQSEGVGDIGYGFSSELRSPSLAAKLPGFVDEWRFFGFIDNGQVRILRALPDQTRQRALLSVGGGARFQLFKYLKGEFAVGMPLFNGTTSERKSVRTTFSAKGEF
jgi:hemolysin activation/secretion protein